MIFITKTDDSKDLENGSANKAKAGTAVFLIELEEKRSIKASGYTSLKFHKLFSFVVEQ